MGSRGMAVFKRLSVLLVVAGPCAWTTPQFPSLTPTTTPVPILRYIDKQNTDGSYTYGFEGADGTYKLETRFVDGRVKGKYGYIDPDGVLREASYGAEAGRGFEPEIQGVELPPPTIVQEIQNEIPQTLQPTIQNSQRFKNFRAQTVTTKNQETGKVKIVNGRRAVLKKRLRVKATPAPQRFVDPDVQKQNNLRARQEQLRILDNHRQQLLQLQQSQAGGRQNAVRAFSGFQQPLQETVRSGVSDPYVNGVNLADGSYSYSYCK